MINKVFVSSSIASFELSNDRCYYSAFKYQVYLNEKFVKEDNTNVFTVYNLKPDFLYVLRISTNGNDYYYNFKTRVESSCINLKDFGLKEDKDYDNAPVINLAIFSAPKDARIIVPKGEYYVSAIFMKDDITLELKKDAKLIQISDLSRIPYLPKNIRLSNKVDYILGVAEGKSNVLYAATINFSGVKNVNLIGEGTIEGTVQNTEKDKYPSNVLFFNHTKNINIIGLTIINSSYFNIHMFFSKNCQLINNKIINNISGFGTNLESCQNINYLGNKTCDCTNKGLTISSCDYIFGSKYKTASQEIIIRNCLFTNCNNGLAIGPYIAGGIRNILCSYCLLDNTECGIFMNVLSDQGKYAIIDGLTYEKISMNKIGTAIAIKAYEQNLSKDNKKVISVNETQLPTIGKIEFKDFDCKEIIECAGYFLGFAKKSINSITLHNYLVEMKETDNKKEIKQKPLSFVNVNQLTLDKVKISNCIDSKYSVENVKEIIDRDHSLLNIVKSIKKRTKKE